MAKTAEAQITYWGAPGIRSVKSVDVELLFRQYPEECFNIVKEVVCKFRNVSLTDFYSRSRNRPKVVARQLFCYIIYHYFKFNHISLKVIGEQLSDKVNYDHTTVIHGKNTIRDLLYTKSINQKDIDTMVVLINRNLNKIWQSSQ